MDTYQMELYHHSDYPKIKNECLDPVSFDGTRRICEQMKRGICKVIYRSQSGIGFLCRILEQGREIRVLIAPEHLLCGIEYYHEKNIKIILDDDLKELKLNENRFIYQNKEYNIAMVEIIEKDEIDAYLELDDKIYYEHKNLSDLPEYDRKCIYILHYYSKRLCVSYGFMRTLNDSENSEIFSHNCSTEIYSYGSPILDLNTNKILGIHKVYNRKRRILEGTIFSKEIEEFLKLYRIKDSNFKEYKESDFTNCKLLGTGGYGDVFSAYSIKDKKEICLKKINIEKMKIIYRQNELSNYEKDLENEIYILKLLSFNNNSVKYYGKYEKENEEVIVMEKCDKNLKEFIKERGTGLTVKEIKKHFLEINYLNICKRKKLFTGI